MIRRIEFRNFKILQAAVLPLGRFTLIVGPNGSGKSTALQALKALSEPGNSSFSNTASIGLVPNEDAVVELILTWGPPFEEQTTTTRWTKASQASQSPFRRRVAFGDANRPDPSKLRVRVFSLNPAAIALPVMLEPSMELQPDGSHLAGVLENLRDQDPERFERLNAELVRWLPDYDRILFDTPKSGMKGLLLRTRIGRHQIRAPELSQGTLLALAMLTLAHLKDPPSIVGLEEPDRGVHPRLLREVRDALYRLSHPESFNEDRPPVQVIATTHSPYLLDFYKDHPDEVVISQREGLYASFHRLSELPNVDEILNGASLGDIWYSGILGGVPVGT